MKKPARPAPASRSARATDKRRLLLKAAFDEVASRGFSAVTLEDIADRAGVSKGVTLYHFESKEQLFRELFRWVVERLHDRMRSVLEKPTALEQLAALNDVIFASPELNRAFYAVFLDFSSLAVRNESFREVNAAFFEGCAGVERAIVERGVREGVFPAQDASRAVLLLRSLFDGLMLRWLSEESPREAFAFYRASCQEQALTILLAPENRRKPHEKAHAEVEPRGGRAGAPALPPPGMREGAPRDLGDPGAPVRRVRAGEGPVRPRGAVAKARRGRAS